tara:strand:+ start:220 stop:579 length:360 start_codon:yes stop_codon:yes gene_type:complete
LRLGAVQDFSFQDTCGFSGPYEVTVIHATGLQRFASTCDERHTFLVLKIKKSSPSTFPKDGLCINLKRHAPQMLSSLFPCLDSIVRALKTLLYASPEVWTVTAGGVVEGMGRESKGLAY